MDEDNDVRSCWVKAIPMPKPLIVSGGTKGRIVGITELGLPLVEFGGGAVPARIIEPAPIEVLEAFVVSRAEVLLTFQDGDRARPVVVSDLWLDERERRGIRISGEGLPFPECVSIEGRQVAVTCDEVTFKCGPQSTITFRRNRKAIVRVARVEIDSVDAEFLKSLDIRLIE